MSSYDQVVGMQKTIAELRSELSDANATIALVNDANRTLQSIAGELREDVRETTACMNLANAICDKHERTISSLQSTIASRDESIASKDRLYTVLDGNYDRLEAEANTVIAQLRTDLSEARCHATARVVRSLVASTN